MRRTYALFGIGLVLTAIVWLGLSAFIGSKAGQRMEQAFAPVTGSGLRSVLRPERQDILASSFSQDLELDTGVLPLFLPVPPTVRVRLSHELAHGPLVRTTDGLRLGLAHVRTTIAAEGTDWDALSALAERPDILRAASLDTSIDFSGPTRTVVSLPEGLTLRLPADGQTDAPAMRLGKLNGWVAQDASGSVRFDLFMDRLISQGLGERSESQGLRFYGSVWKNAKGWTESSFTQHVSKTASESRKGADFSSSGLDDGTVLTLTADDQGYALRADRGISRLEVNSVALSEVKCRLLVSRIDPELWPGLTGALEPVVRRTLRAAQAGEPLGHEARERLLIGMLQAAAPLLAARPPRLDIEEISALNPGGLAAASGAVWIDPSAAGTPGAGGLLAGLRARATAAMSRRFPDHLGDLAVLSFFMDQWVAQGFASEQQDRIESRLEFDGQAVLVNGRPLP